MANNLNVYSLLGDKISSFSDYENWRKFLECSGWNFKYTWAQQVLIYAQRPDSKACANQEVWAKLGRYVKKDARIISVIDESINNRLGISHIIDVSDTASPTGKNLDLWSFNSENSKYVLNHLSEICNIPRSDMAVSDADQLAYIISEYVKDSNVNVSEEFKLFVTNSIICQVFSRCELSPYFNGESLAYGIEEAPDTETFTILGHYIQDIAKQILLEIHQGVKEFNKNQLLNMNKEVNNDERQQNIVSNERGLSDSKSGNSSEAGTGQIRDNETDISERAETGTVLGDDGEWNIDGQPVEDRGTNQENDSAVYRRDEEEKSTSEGSDQYGMGSVHESSEEDGRGDNSSTDNLELVSDYDLGAGYLGNGLTVWDRNQTEKQDYRTVAHISKEGVITFYDENLPKDSTALGKVREWAESEREKFIASQEEQKIAEEKQREFLAENIIFPSEAEQKEAAEVVEQQNETEFLDRTPLSHEIDVSSAVFENTETVQDDINELQFPSKGEVVTLQGSDYCITDINETTVTVQDVVSPLFTQEIEKEVFAILMQNSGYITVREVNSEETEKTVEPEVIAAIPEKTEDVQQERKDAEHIVRPEQEKVIRKSRKTYPQRQYDFFKKYVPEFMNGNFDYIRLESEGFEPLYIERIDNNQIAIAHTYEQYGDLMLDPEMVFLVDDEKQEVYPISFEHSYPPMMSRVYGYNDIEFKYPDKKIERDLQQFFNTWSKNLTWQEHVPVRAVKYDAEKGDIEYKYVDGKFISEEEIEKDNNKVTGNQLDNDAIRIYGFLEKYASEIIREERELVQLDGVNDERLSIQDIGDGHIALYYTTKDENGFANTYDFDFRLNRNTDDISFYINTYTPSWFNSIVDMEWVPYVSESKEQPVQETENKNVEPVVGEINEIHISSEGNINPEREYTLFDFALPEDDPVFTPEPVKAVPEISAPERKNYSNPYIENHLEENYGPPRARYANNVAAIKLLKTLEEENRLATPAEQNVLSKYVGWGGLSEAFDSNKWPREYEELKNLLTKKEYDSARESTLTAFFTPPVVLEAIYDALRNFGFSKGNILEPACGTGNFFGMLPKDMNSSKLYGVELDSLSGRIAQHLYPESNIAIEGFEDTNLPDNFFDVTIGNVPFGDFNIYDPKYNQYGFRIHDYFFAKGLDKLRPGGVMAYITSSGTMDKTNSNVRKYIAQRADLLGAIRLPNDTFKNNAGTTVTSDILFFKKRDTPKVEAPEWIDTEKFEDTDLSINSYFINHPEMVLGEIKEVSGPHGPQLSCLPEEGINLRDKLHTAIKNIKGEYVSSIETLSFDDIEEADTIEATPDVRNFSYTLVNDTVYFRENSIMHKVDKNATAEKRIKGLIGVRDILRSLIDAQVEGASDETIISLQNQLNNAYDSFVNQFGIINSRGNDLAFSDDSAYYLLCSLEKIDSEGNFEGKADIFHKRTIAAPHSVESVNTPEEAMTVSIGERGKVDIEFMSSLCDKSPEEIVQSMQGKLFKVPGTDNEYEPSNIYLSGNIVTKLKAAREAVSQDETFNINIKALEEAMPEPLGPADIEVTFGSTWIPVDIYNEFMHELLEHRGSWYKDRINIEYNDITDTFTITNKNYDYSVQNDSKFGTKRMKALQIMEHALNGRTIKIYDTVHDYATGKDRRVLNTEDTFAARAKKDDIEERFLNWLWKDVSRSDRLCKIYNEKFNCIVPPKYDGNTVIFHGMNPEIQLREYQKDAVARILQGGNTALAHAVGAGKTFTMISGAMEAKQLGLCNKAMIVVPNHLIGQWASAIYELYPTANVLASTKKDFEKKNRKKFCSRIATGDYDIVVIGHSQFERIPISQERQEALLKEQIESIVQAIDEEKMENSSRSLSVKELERTKKGLETRLKKLQETDKRDDVITFEELGVDKLLVDESHYYKNLFLYTKKSNIAGISQTDSQRASDMFMKCRYLDEITGNKGIVFATGTLISNSIAETYTNQRYLQYDRLKEMGLDTFDKWSSTFALATSSLELAPEGTGFKERTRFSKFFNLPELMNLFKMNVDIQTEEMLNLPLPEVKYETVVLEPSEEQSDYVLGLADRAERIRSGGVDPSEDNMLKITNEGRKLALDQRLVDPELPDNPNSKAVACADKIYELWLSGADEKLTQTVFCDLSTPTTKGFNVYQDLKEKLIERGIPEEEIKFVHEAKTDTQKEDLFAKVRSGEVRVLMGSTSKMGTGTNVQDRLIAGHDLDCPWRPSDLEQRKGRVVRFGNQNDKVHMYRYVTEGTFDAYMYQLIENKQRMISQILTGKSPLRSAADVDDMTLNYAEIKGLATGNPMIMEKVGLEIEIQRLEMVRTRFINQQFDLQMNVKNYWPEKLKAAKERLVGLKKDLELYVNNPIPEESGPKVTVNGEEFETDDLAGKAVLKEISNISQGKTKVIGKIQDFDILVRRPDLHVLLANPELIVKGTRAYTVDYTNTGYGTVKRMANMLKSIEERRKNCEKEIEKYTTLISEGEKEMDKPFPKEEELIEKKAKLAEIDAQLTILDNKSFNNEEMDLSDDEIGGPDYVPIDNMIASANQRCQNLYIDRKDYEISNDRR